MPKWKESKRFCDNDGLALTEKALEESQNNVGIHGSFSSFDEMMESIIVSTLEKR